MMNLKIELQIRRKVGYYGTEINSLLRLYPLDLLNIDNEKFEFKNKQSGETNG